MKEFWTTIQVVFAGSAAGWDGSWEDVTACFTRFWLS